MNIYILATVINGYTTVDILSNSVKVQGIITLKKECSSKVNEYYDYSKYCKEKRIECIEVESYSLEELQDRSFLSKLNIDLLIILGWQRLIPEWLINQCKIGVIGAHGSPWGIVSGRGRSPQNWALLMGMKKFYISIFWVTGEIDDGDIIDTEEIEYTDSDDISSSYLKCNIAIANMIVNNLHNQRIMLRQGFKQNGEQRYLPQRKAEDGEIDWDREGYDIYNFVRALTRPYPGAFTRWNDSTIYVWHLIYLNVNADVWNKQNPGTVVQVLPDDRFLVKCKDGLVLIDDYSIVGNDKIFQGIRFCSVDYEKQIDKIIKRHYSKYSSKINEEIIALGSHKNLF